MHPLCLFRKSLHSFKDFATNKSKLASACSFYYSITKFHQYISPCPLVWDPETELLVHSNPHKNSLFPSIWYFNVFIIIGIVGLGSCIHVILNYKSPDVDKPLLVMSFGFATLAILCFAGSCIIAILADSIATGIKEYQSLYLKSYEAQNKMTGVYKQALRIHQSSYWDILAIFLSFFIYFMFIIPAFIVPGGIYLQIDPFSFTFRKVICAKFICGTQMASNTTTNCFQIVSTLILLLRIISSTTCVVEACRFLSLYFLIILYALEFLHKSAEIVGTMVPYSCLITSKQVTYQYSQFIKWYTSLVLGPQIINEPMSLLVAVLMGSGFVIFVTCNLATIRCFEMLPLIIYWLMPTVSVFCSFFVYFMLQLTVEADIYSRKISYQARRSYASLHRSSMMSLDRKVNERKLNMLWPIKISCGSFYVVKRGAETDYYFHVFLRTVDGVLLPIWHK